METTRKQAGPVAALILALGGSGCATPGPLHTYTLEAPTSANVRDHGQAANAEVPVFLEAGERVAGFAYDPFTDHFFLRLAGSDTIRVVDRPARSVKRSFAIPGLDPAGGDLAIRPRDGHVFFLQGGQPAVLETTRLGKPLRTFTLEGVAGADAIALDPRDQRLLVLHSNRLTLTWHDLEGRSVGQFALKFRGGRSIAFDPDRREIYTPLVDSRHQVGVFGLDGRLIRTMETTARFLDVGPRSFIRVF